MRPALELPEGFADAGLPTGTFSHSQYTRFKICAKSYEFRYVQGLKVAPAVAMFRGTSVHAGAEAAHLHMIQHHAAPPLEAMKEVVSGAFEKGKDEVAEWGEDKPGDVKDQSLKLYAKYHADNLPLLRPVAAEEGFAARIGTVPMTGYIDLLEQHSGFAKPAPSDPVIVVDLKTSSAKWSASDVENDTQLTLYSIVKKASLVRIDNLVTLKAGPALHRLESTRTSRQQGVFVEDLEETADFVKRGIFPKASIDSWACSEKWCGYWKQCRGRRT